MTTEFNNRAGRRVSEINRARIKHTIESWAGKKMFSLTVLDEVIQPNGRRVWRVKCDCGQEKLLAPSIITGKLQRTCGLCRRGEVMTGTVFGRLTVTGAGEPAHGHPTYRCRCECGEERDVLHKNLANGRTTQCKSCGKKSQADAARARHAANRAAGKQPITRKQKSQPKPPAEAYEGIPSWMRGF